jgi:hypothetical protein
MGLQHFYGKWANNIFMANGLTTFLWQRSTLIIVGWFAG